MFPVWLFFIILNPPDGPALSLDINQSAANPAALAMAILNSAKSRRRTRSNLQVPLVIISQPGPITSQSSPTLPVLPEKPHQTTSYDSEDSPTVVVLEVNQGSTDPDELPGEVTSLPLDKNQPISEPTSLPVTTVENMPSPEVDQSVVVVVSLL